MKEKKISIRLSEEDFNKLKELVENGESLSAYIRSVLKNHIKTQSKVNEEKAKK